MFSAGELYMETPMRRRNSEKITHSRMRLAAEIKPMKRNELDPSMLAVTLGSWMVAGASTVAGVVAAATLFAGVVAAATLFAGEVAGDVAGLCCATALEVTGSVAGLVAGCVVVPISGGSGARVSEGNAFETTGISTLGEFVVTGPGVFSFFAKACEAGGA